MEKLRNKVTRTTIIGMCITILLYIINAVIINALYVNDIYDSFYPYIPPVLFMVLAVIFGYFTKKMGTKKSFIALYLTLLIPIVCTPSIRYLANRMLFKDYAWSIIYSVTYVVNESGLSDLLGMTSHEADNCWVIFMAVYLMIIAILSSVVYRFTKSTE